MRFNRAEITLAMQVIVSAVMLLAGLKIVFGSYDQDVKKAAFGWIGLVVGYWLK